MRKPNYLVVDDESFFRDFIDAVFADEARITQACDGREALNLLQQRHFDVVICDVQMPRLSGTDLFRQLLSIAPEAAANFIFCTGNPTDELISFCSAHHTSFCTKPIDIATLKSAVYMLTNRKSSKFLRKAGQHSVTGMPAL